MFMPGKHTLSHKTPLERGNRLDSKRRDPRFSRGWEVSVGEPSLGTVNDVQNGYRFEGVLTQGNGPWTFTITVTNNSDEALTLGSTVTKEIDTQSTFTVDDTGFGGELATGGASDSFTVELADEAGVPLSQVSFVINGENFDVSLDMTVLSGEGGGR